MSFRAQGVSNFFWNKLLRYFFERILIVLYIWFMLRFWMDQFSDWLKYVFHYFTNKEWDFQLLQTYVMKTLFWDDSAGAKHINAAIQNGQCKQVIFELTRYSKAGGHHVRSLVLPKFLLFPCFYEFIREKLFLCILKLYLHSL